MALDDIQQEQASWVDPVEINLELTHPQHFLAGIDVNAVTFNEDASTRATDNISGLNRFSSLSSVGTMAATAMVGWNAIPGGFEPLPLSIGGKKKGFQISRFDGGLNLKGDPKDISITECITSSNLSFSKPGRIITSGTGTDEDAGVSITTDSGDDAAAGYGGFAFKTGYSLADPPVRGNHEFLCRWDENALDMNDPVTGENATLNLGGGSQEIEEMSPIIYATANSIYACDANIKSYDSQRQLYTIVDRVDINNGSQTEPMLDWVGGNVLINSPTIGTGNNQVDDDVGTYATVDSTGAVHFFADDSSTAGNWGITGTAETYTFYVSWLFDGIAETAASKIPTGLSCEATSLDFNLSIGHTSESDGTPTNPVGGSARINGMRVYVASATNPERKYFLAEALWEKGIKIYTDSSYTPWAQEATGKYHMASNIVIENPPVANTYVDLNGYYEDEVYLTQKATSNISPILLDYKCATIGADGRVFVANINWDRNTGAVSGQMKADLMMFSAIGRPGVFPFYNTFDSPVSDGGSIWALESIQDKVLQFRDNSVVVVNVSNDRRFYVENIFTGVGVQNPCQVTKTPMGVAWVNNEGCYLFDGSKVISLTHGRFDPSDWGLTSSSIVSEYETGDTEGNAATSPSIGYDFISKKLYVIKNIESDDSASANGNDAYVYDFQTQSLANIKGLVDNSGVTIKMSNFFTYGGRLSYWKSGRANLRNIDSTPAEQAEFEWTSKEIDFGAPSVKKKIYKVIINYTGGTNQNIVVSYGVNGDTTPTEAMSAALDDTTTSGNKRVELTPTGASTSNIYSFQLKLDGTAASTFELHDITIIYRIKKVK